MDAVTCLYSYPASAHAIGSDVVCVDAGGAYDRDLERLVSGCEEEGIYTDGTGRIRISGWRHGCFGFDARFAGILYRKSTKFLYGQ